LVDIAFAIVRSVFLLCFGGLWIASTAWVLWDAKRRLRSERQVKLAVGATIGLPLAGLFLYVLVRPGESVLERRERRAFRRLIELELAAAERCLVCRTEIRPEFRCCPGCGEEVGSSCGGCGSMLRFGWSVCPHCEAPVTAPLPLRVAA
jgi:hypothetical protein